MDNLLEKIPDWILIKNYNILTCKKELRCLCYAPLTTINNERSFSNLNHVKTDKKANMSATLLRSSLGFYYNSRIN